MIRLALALLMLVITAVGVTGCRASGSVGETSVAAPR